MFLKQCLLIASLLWASFVESKSRSLETQRQVVHLLPFDVRIALEKGSNPNDVNIYTLKQLVTSWMDASFQTESENEALLSSATNFDYTLLEIVNNRRSLQEGDPSSSYTEAEFYQAIFQGFSVWNVEGPNFETVDSEVVELIQRATFLEDKKLLDLIRQTEDYAGMGTKVLDVRVEVVDPSDYQGDDETEESPDKSLEIIITIAIVVACLAFCLLMFAVVWAWRTDRTKREAYKVGRNPPGVMPDRTGSESDPDSPAKEQSPKRGSPRKGQPPAEIPGQSNYPESAESVISEDIETSFTAYYNSQAQQQQQPPQPMSTPSTPSSQPYNTPTQPSARHEPKFNDAASMSSMDSYGYSLDGYASSLGGPQKYPGGALNMPSNNGSVEPDSDADLAPSENGDVAMY